MGRIVPTTMPYQALQAPIIAASQYAASMQVFRHVIGSKPSAVTIGNFDGVHLGHQAVLRVLTERARQRGLVSTVLTFEPHPREYFAFLRQDPSLAPARIATLRDRLAAISRCGVDQTIVLGFDAKFAGISAQSFIDEVLVKHLNTRYLIVGDDFRFGAKRTGDFAMLQSQASSKGYELTSLETQELQGKRISSTAVRSALAQGDFAEACEMIGAPYAISGHVVHGRKLGRTWNFPTLNIRLWRKNDQITARPAVSGIFVVQVYGLAEKPLAAVASLGTRPAVEANGEFLLEVHLFDFKREVYGACVRVEFLKKLRDEASFDSFELLVKQIERDAQAARSYFAI